MHSAQVVILAKCIQIIGILREYHSAKNGCPGLHGWATVKGAIWKLASLTLEPWDTMVPLAFQIVSNLKIRNRNLGRCSCKLLFKTALKNWLPKDPGHDVFEQTKV